MHHDGWLTAAIRSAAFSVLDRGPSTPVAAIHPTLELIHQLVAMATIFGAVTRSTSAS